MPKKKNNPSRAKVKEKRLRVWVEPDNVAEIRTEIARNGRTIQGETNCILRDYYASKWDVPPASAGADALRRF
jgi:hypothetical protein